VAAVASECKQLTSLDLTFCGINSAIHFITHF